MDRARSALALVLMMGLGAAATQPATAPSPQDSPPPISIDKAKGMSHFTQLDPRYFGEEGKLYCGPTAVSDCMLYFAAHGYPKLNLLDVADAELSQTALVERLASDKYMDTGLGPLRFGTTVPRLIFGMRKYVRERGYTIRRCQYAGISWKPQGGNVYCGEKVDLDWIKQVVADPNGAAWLEIGWYTRGKTPGEWFRHSGHWVAVVGYGSDGSQKDPHLLLLDNPAMGARIVLPGRGPLTAPGRTRPITIADQAVILTPSGPGTFINDEQTNRRTVDGDGLFQVTGPGLPFSHKKIDAAFVQGAVVLIVGPPKEAQPSTR